MHHYLVELYTPNAVWQSLPIEERKQYLNNVGAAMGNLSDIGVEVLTLTETVHKIDQASEHQFLGIWRFPNQQARKALLEGIHASGWYKYFNHINAAGAEGNFPQHIAALANT